MKSLSVSQAESFDPSQYGGCNRRWYFERVEGHKQEESDSKTDGTMGHALLATYLRTGQGPVGRVRMGKAVRAAIAKGELPAPGSDLQVEQRFDGQPQYDASGAHVPLDTAKTLWLGGVPWDGYIDLRFRRSDVPVILDHKFTSDIEGKLTAVPSLLGTIQLPVYCMDSLRVWPDAKRFIIAHHYVSRSGEQSLLRREIVTLDQVLEREEQITGLVREIDLVRTARNQNDVRFNREACTAFGGCPHQSRCSAFKEKVDMMTPEDYALFGLEAPAAASPAQTEEADLFGPVGVVPPDAPKNDPTLTKDAAPNPAALTQALASYTANAPRKAPAQKGDPIAGLPPASLAVETVPGVTVTPGPNETIEDVKAEAPKRTRRTKAEMEAARAGDAAGHARAFDDEDRKAVAQAEIAAERAKSPSLRPEVAEAMTAEPEDVRPASTVVHEIGPLAASLLSRLLTRLGA